MQGLQGGAGLDGGRAFQGVSVSGRRIRSSSYSGAPQQGAPGMPLEAESRASADAPARNPAAPPAAAPSGPAAPGNQLTPEAAVAETYLDRAKDNLLRGDYAAAEADARAALRLNPRDSVAWEVLAYSLLRQGRFAEAIAAATEAIRLNPNSADAYRYRAYAKDAMGDRAGALADLERAAQLNPAFLAEFNAALAGGKIYDPARDDAFYLLGKTTQGGGMRGVAIWLGLLAFLLAGAAVLRYLLLNQSSRKRSR